jgi:hypothetical protein
MLSEANVAIESASEREARQQELKYARRNKMRYIDQLLNELEMLNLADRTDLPTGLSAAVDTLLAESEVETDLRPDNIVTAMDLLYEIQDSLMYNQIEDE